MPARRPNIRRELRIRRYSSFWGAPEGKFGSFDFKGGKKSGQNIQFGFDS